MSLLMNTRTNMSKKTDLGIFLKKTKTFYYLEYGNNYVGNTLDRIRKTLIQRNLLDGTVDTRSVQYEIISLQKALQSNLETKPIFISKYIQSLHEEKTRVTTLNEGAFK